MRDATEPAALRPRHFSHPLFARYYARLSTAMEADLGPRRRELLTGLAGSVLEIGAGNGMNFAHYPPSVTRVVAVEPEPYLRSLGVAAAARAPVPIEVVDAHADALPDGPFDAVVATLVLCSVPDVPSALAGIREALRPGGELRFLEHVRADTKLLARLQQVLDATIWPHLAAGCHMRRDPVGQLAAAGFEVRRISRFRFPDGRLTGPTSPHAMGIAIAR